MRKASCKFRFVVVWLGFFAAFRLAAAPGYHLVRQIKLEGETRWDGAAVDSKARRVYITHETKVDVLDADTLKVVGTIPNTLHIHDVVLAPDLGRGFTTNSTTQNSSMFDLKTLEVLAQIPTGQGPDDTVYDPSTHRVFTMNVTDKSMTVIDAQGGKIIDTVSLAPNRAGGAVSDGKGSIFVDMEKGNAIIKMNAATLKREQTWSTAGSGCEEGPGSLAFDPKANRLFAGCDNGILLIVDSVSGKVVTTVPIQEMVDSTIFEASTGLIFNACRDSVVVVHQDTPDKYSVVETVPTRLGSVHMAMDPVTHRLFLGSGEIHLVPGQRQPTRVPDTFELLVFEPGRNAK